MSIEICCPARKRLPLLRNVRTIPLIGAALYAVALGGCSGSSGVASPAPIASTRPAPSPVSPDSFGTLTVHVFIPNHSTLTSLAGSRASVRHPQYVPSTVNSIAFTATESGGSSVTGSPLIIAVGSAACSAAGGGQTCSTALTGALGQDGWTVETFATVNGTGTPLSRAPLVATIVAGQANVSNLTLSPVLNALAFVPFSASCNAATACAQSLVLDPLDATGATIVGPGTFVNAAGAAAPITLSASTTLTLETSSASAAHTVLNVAGDGNLAQIGYDGTGSTGVKTVTASAAGLSATFSLTLASGSMTAPASVSIGNTNPTSTTIGVTETSYAGAFTQTNNCTGIATIGAASGNGPSATFPVTQLGGGTCSVLIADNHGGTVAVSVISTTYQVVLQ